MIRRELENVREQLENVTKKKGHGLKKIKAQFLTSRASRAEFDREESQQQDQEHVAAEKKKQKSDETV